jgi:alpha-L-fucosidase
LREYLPLGQRVDNWALDIWQNDQWVEFAKGTAIGSRRLVRANYISASKVRLRITRAAACPAIREIALHREPDWARIGSATKDSPDLGMSKKGWKIHAWSYEANNGGEASRAIDGKVETMWHTHGPDGDQGTPQFVAIDMGKEVEIKAFLFMPPSDGESLSLVDQYEYHVSPDGEAWTKVAHGEFDNIINNPVQQIVQLEKPVMARYFKFIATHSAGGVTVSAAELGIRSSLIKAN